MQIVSDIQQIVRQAQQYALRNINKAMVQEYWLVGRRIVEDEQLGERRAAYGKSLIKNLLVQLQKEFGKGFSVRNIKHIMLFYITYSNPQTASAVLENVPNSPKISSQSKIPDFQLSWLHYHALLRMDDENECKFYEIEAAKNQWSL